MSSTLSKLGDFKLEILVERSGSMGNRDCDISGDSVSRWHFVGDQVAQLVAEAQCHQPAGVFVGFFDTVLHALPSANAESVRAAFRREMPGGGTNLADAIYARTQAHFVRQGLGDTRKLLLVVVTDGEPTGTTVPGISRDPQLAVADAIQLATSRLSQHSGLLILFFQPGSDRVGADFINWLTHGLSSVMSVPPETVHSARLVQMENSGLVGLVAAAVESALTS